MVQKQESEVREARPNDATAIRRIARSSLEYTDSDVLSPETIGKVVDKWYEPETFEPRLENPDTIVVVGKLGSEITGFADAVLEDDGEVGVINWLLVDPHHRREGFGEAILDEIETALMEADASRIEGLVLGDNEVGNAFYEAEGYTLKGSRTIELGGETVRENRYLRVPGVDTVEGLLEPVDIDGRTVYVALDERERGTEDPFYKVYSDEERTESYGFYCANCTSMGVSMDTMGQMVCEECGNRRKHTRWDSVYM